MSDDKLIKAMAILERMQSYDIEGKDPLAASALRQWAGEVRDALAAAQAELRECCRYPKHTTPRSAITFCDNCGCSWLDDGLNPIGCPYCKQSAEIERDEALLRQALEALERGAWDTLSGRNAAFAIRERLGLGQEE